jgi:hypothetical protein
MDTSTNAPRRPATKAEPTTSPPDANTYGPGQALSFAAHAALFHPDKVEFVPESEAEARAFRREQRRLLARRPELKQLVASRMVPLSHAAPRAREARPAPVRRRGSRRTTGSGSSSSGEDPDSDEPPGLTLRRLPRYGRVSPNLVRILIGGSS